MPTGERIRMTLSDGEREFCLSYAERELLALMGLRGADEWFPEGAAFVAATGIYDNWSVAHGQNTSGMKNVSISDGWFATISTRPRHM